MRSQFKFYPVRDHYYPYEIGNGLSQSRKDFLPIVTARNNILTSAVIVISATPSLVEAVGAYYWLAKFYCRTPLSHHPRPAG